jgi:hypothetical protein
LRWWAFRFFGQQIGIGQMRLLVQHHSFIPFASRHERIDGHGLITASVGARAPEDFDFGSPISIAVHQFSTATVSDYSLHGAARRWRCWLVTAVLIGTALWQPLEGAPELTKPAAWLYDLYEARIANLRENPPPENWNAHLRFCADI